MAKARASSRIKLYLNACTVSDHTIYQHGTPQARRSSEPSASCRLVGGRGRPR